MQGRPGNMGGEGASPVLKPGLCCHLVSIEGSAPVPPLGASSGVDRAEHCAPSPPDTGRNKVQPIILYSSFTAYSLASRPPSDVTQNSTQHRILTKIEGQQKFPKDREASGK